LRGALAPKQSSPASDTRKKLLLINALDIYFFLGSRDRQHQKRSRRPIAADASFATDLSAVDETLTETHRRASLAFEIIGICSAPNSTLAQTR
jgi:hypothetical protein